MFSFRWVVGQAPSRLHSSASSLFWRKNTAVLGLREWLQGFVSSRTEALVFAVRDFTALVKGRVHERQDIIAPLRPLGCYAHLVYRHSYLSTCCLHYSLLLGKVIFGYTMQTEVCFTFTFGINMFQSWCLLFFFLILTYFDYYRSKLIYNQIVILNFDNLCITKSILVLCTYFIWKWDELMCNTNSSNSLKFTFKSFTINMK